MTWSPEDARELQALRVAVSDIRDAYLAASIDDYDEPAQPERVGCPFCRSPNVVDMATFGTPPGVLDEACSDCGAAWVVQTHAGPEGLVERTTTTFPPVGPPAPTDGTTSTC